jgi:predicted ArsR family transcriptional regulator
MFLPGFRDLVKEGWVKILEELKVSGGLPVPELSRRLGGSYMGMKDQCDRLVKMGYLERWRLPRQEVGRPEIMYRLAAKADAIFPQAGVSLSLELLEAARSLFGDAAPERLLMQYFGQLRERWSPHRVRSSACPPITLSPASSPPRPSCDSREPSPRTPRSPKPCARWWKTTVC